MQEVDDGSAIAITREKDWESFTVKLNQLDSTFTTFEIWLQNFCNYTYDQTFHQLG